MSFAKFDNRLLAEFVASRTKRFSSNLSNVKLEHLHIPGNTDENRLEWSSIAGENADYGLKKAFQDTSE